MTTSSLILEKYWDRYFPVDILSIAKKTVVSIDNKNYKIIVQQIKDDYVSGRAFFADNNFVLQYNINEHHLRQRFVIAHELGHIVLGHVKYNKSKIDNNKTTFNQKEIDANNFAISILMPKNSVRHYHYGFASITALASIFDVSEIAMKNRLINLSLPC